LLFTGAIIFGAGYVAVARNRNQAAEHSRELHAATPASTSSQGTRVEVQHPSKGGLERTTNQPGSVISYEGAALYAKVSGYLKKLNVDIGDHVKEGDVLAEIDVPELVKAVDQAKAVVEQTGATVKQAEARVKTAEATVKASEANVKQASAQIERYVAEREYHKKELDRITLLASRNSIEQKLVDEKQDQYDSSLAAEHAAEAAVLSAKAQLVESQARVDQAKADLMASEASLDVAKQDLQKAQVLADYRVITSPYTGVITARNYFRGDFIRSAADGEAQPLLNVARTDLMRVVVQVPDLDVSLVSKGDPAVIEIDALRGKRFEGTVSRFSESEGTDDRTMRTEIDLPNPDGLLRDGMYGRATIVLDPPSTNLTVSSSSLVEHAEDGKGAVFVVRDGKAHRVNVQVGKDNGLQAEILSGLHAEDEVVVQSGGSLTDGLAVQVESTHLAKAGEPAGH
jgi:RND family efflux transporter MFP subunit